MRKVVSCRLFFLNINTCEILGRLFYVNFIKFLKIYNFFMIGISVFKFIIIWRCY